MWCVYIARYLQRTGVENSSLPGRTFVRTMFVDVLDLENAKHRQIRHQFGTYRSKFSYFRFSRLVNCVFECCNLAPTRFLIPQFCCGMSLQIHPARFSENLSKDIPPRVNPNLNFRLSHHLSNGCMGVGQSFSGPRKGVLGCMKHDSHRHTNHRTCYLMEH